MKPGDHYLRAEALMAEGEAVVHEIQLAGSRRPDLNAAELDVVRDRLGKKAMGIWAQAQVHATLATTRIESVTYNVRSALR